MMILDSGLLCLDHPVVTPTNELAVGSANSWKLTKNVTRQIGARNLICQHSKFTNRPDRVSANRLVSTTSPPVGVVAQWLKRRSLAGGLSLIYAWSTGLTCDNFVGKVSATGQPTRPTQPSIPSGSVNE